MAAPIYSQEEADAMIEMQKRMDHEAWENRKTGRSPGSIEVTARPENDVDGRIKFVIEICPHDLTDKLTYTLKGRIGKRPFEGLCRYDIHDNGHDNPTWCPPVYVEPGVFHRHLYSERCVKEFDRWDKCAHLLDLSNDGSPAQLNNRLWKRFFKDMLIKYSESGSLFGIEEMINE